MTRLTAISLALACLLAPLPALAGPAEEAYLGSLTGKWAGRGTLTGAETGVINCSLVVRKRSVGANFGAKCDVEDLGPQNFTSVITYNDAEKRYEARSTGGELTLGTKSGNTLTFVGKVKGLASGTSTMKISPSRIIIDTLVRRPGGDSDIKSHMEMKR
ncbi:MAG: hypothetical protein EOP22_09945 [Hyphomicrobiales bacterium]|nr:MAG: hypothetical protein EOP22_09945 [Hyphomicrobiales bacterium]